MPRGGARPNSGPKKGSKHLATLSKEAAREVLRQVILTHMDEMVAAQVAHAKGLSFLMVRESSTGKFLKVGKHRAEKLDPNQEIIEVWEKDPSVQAFTDLMNRCLDKPAEQTQKHEITGVLSVVEGRLLTARKRLSNLENP